MEIGVVLVHNKNEEENEAQVSSLLPLIDICTQTNFGVNEEGEEFSYNTFYYTLEGLPTDYKFKFYQVVPYGIAVPSNLNSIDSYKVFYGEKDEDKTGDHARFFNWGLKRAIDQGAELILFISDASKITSEGILSLIENFSGEYAQTSFGFLVSRSFQENHGQLDEEIDLNETLSELTE